MQMRSPYAQVSLPALFCPQVKLKLWLASGLALLYLGWGREVRSQIVPDATLSTNVTTLDNQKFTINDGNRAGNNLFHSFREFSIPTGGEAFFNNAVEIQNIFSRVTGNSISNIDGLIRANGTANLFLINPNGIIFGQNAKLNIGGSFLGSTASSIKFGDGIEFSATNPQAAPLLSINVPVGLQYGNNPGEIRVQGKGQEFGQEDLTESFHSELNPLEVTPGKNLILVGGNVIVDGGILQAPGGRVEIGGLAGEGTVELNADGSLSFPDGVTGETPVPQADVSIINKAGINVLAGGGGSIAITARNIDISGESLFSAGIASDLGSPESRAGDISLSATEGIAIDSSFIQNNVNPDAVGNSGNIRINAKSVSVTNGADIDTSTFGQGNAGSITIIASDTVSFDGGGKDGSPRGIGSTVQAGAVGNAGEISITAQSVSLTNGVDIDTSTFGQGNAGKVTIIASDTIFLDGESEDGTPSNLGSTVQPDAVGDAGGISITAKSLFVTNGAQLDTSTNGRGNAGIVNIIASDTVTFDGEGKDGLPSGAFSRVEPSAEGDAGGVSITAKSLFVTNGAELSSSTLGQGNAGSVTIMASDTVTFDGERQNGSNSGAFSQVNSNAVGDAGDVSITAKSVNVTNGAQLSSSTNGRGNAGIVNIIASDTVTFDGERKDGKSSSGAFSQVNSNGVGDGLGVSITAKSLLVTNGAQLSSSTFGQGNAGRVTIMASDTVTFDGERKDGLSSGAFSLVNSNGVGDAGDVSITAKSANVTNGAQLSSSTFGQGNAGSVRIIASDTVTFDGERKDGKFSSGAFSQVNSNAVGDAGDVSITAKSVNVTNGAQVSSSTLGQGKAGSVRIMASDTVTFDGERKDGSNSGAFSRVNLNGVGDAGDVSITAKSANVTNGAQLSSSTDGQGNAGSVTMMASDTVTFDGSRKDGLSSGAFSQVNSNGVGDAGGVSITAKSVNLTNGTRLSSASRGQGAAGNILVEADAINLNNKALISTETIQGFNSTREDQASIRLGASSLILHQNSRITTNAQGENIIGGNITINADVIAALDNSDISANSLNARGGNIIINAQAIFGAQSRTREELQSLLNTDDPTLLDPRNLLSSDITATGADSSLSGTVAVNTPDVDPSSGLLVLPDNLVDATSLVASSCRSTGTEQNQFVVTGKGGLPPSPLEALDSSATWVDLRLTDSSQTGIVGKLPNFHSPSPMSNTQIVEAQGWVVNSKGEVELVAQAPTARPHNSGLAQQQCYAR
ncbi:two-partner secretion domain-containing protein [Aerosakkonema funiforme]|uniref:Filamentous hemagglutinin N-terminal domain-containing protein n=2 Tax=Oscillatoriophycideae TaxID=1301283 RepID=A0A926ZIL3_9CYAN|nr:filamentous hemagglutinin N-terminal domain-containing protein [Aerosakkonema funiforme]MBD2184175.1 filamentous hemagglutinin N-terminal domain-containing protein [Aerosakkonema funiforme FACHB-1375]